MLVKTIFDFWFLLKFIGSISKRNIDGAMKTLNFNSNFKLKI